MSEARARGATALGEAVRSVSDQVLAAAAGFLVSLYVARAIGVEALGLYAVTHVGVVVVLTVHNALVLQGLSVFGPRRAAGERAAYLGFATLGGVAVAAAVSLPGAGLGAVLGGGLTAEAGRAAVAAFVHANGIALLGLIRRQFYVERRPAAALMQSAVYLALVAAGLGLLTRFGAPTVPRVYAVLAAASWTIGGVQFARLGSRLRRPDRTAARAWLAEHWEFGKWLLAAAPLVVGTHQGYYRLTGALLPAAATGALKAVDTLILPFDQVAIGLSLLLTPWVAGRIDAMSRRELRRLAARLAGGFSLLALAYSAAILVLGPWLLAGLFGLDGEESRQTLRVLSWLPLCKGLAVPANVLVMGLVRPKINLVSRLVATAATLSLGLWLVRSHGAPGAAAGLLLSFAILAAGLWYGVSRTWGRRGSGERSSPASSSSPDNS